jgi:hypothetical protein
MSKNPPNKGGTGPKVTAQSKTKGPIIGRHNGPQQGPVGPWSLKQGTNKGLGSDKRVKKS